MTYEFRIKSNRCIIWRWFKISLGSHWKEIKINDASGVIPVGEETLNLKTGTGISIVPNSSDDPQSLTFAINAEFTDLSGVPSEYTNNKGKYLRVNTEETGLEFSESGLEFSESGLEVVNELPTENLYNNQIVVRSIDNTIHRYDISSNRWVSVGGSSNDESEYKQILNFDVLTYQDGLNGVIINYYDNNTDITNWNKIVEAEYEYLPNTKQIAISYNAFITSNSNAINSSLSGFGGSVGIMEWVICIDDNIITNSRNYVKVDLIERYANIKTNIIFTENDADVDISNNIIKVSESKIIKIYARSIYNRSENLVKLHQTQNGLARPDNFEVASIGNACGGSSCKNVVDYKTDIMDVSENTITYSSYNSINDISDNWTAIELIDSYLPPYKTKNILLKYTPFVTFSNDAYLGVRGSNAVIEWVFKIGDTILPNSRQFIHLDLIERYFTIETNIKIDETENLSKNIISEWNSQKSIKIFARSIFNNVNNNVKLHTSQLSLSQKKPTIEIICISNYDGQTKINTASTSSSGGGTTNSNTSDDRIKHNEVNITNGINIIKQLQPKYYIKTNQLYDANHNFNVNSVGEPVDSNGNKLGIQYTMEAGLIAQDVQKIPQLRHTVEGYENDFDGNLVLPQNKALTVKYNDIFVYTVQALKEVIEKNKILEDKITHLEQRINS